MTPDEWPHMRSIARCVLPVLVGPRIALTGASVRGAMMSQNVAALAVNARIRTVLTAILRHGSGVDGSTEVFDRLRPAERRRQDACARSAASRVDQRRGPCAAVQRSRLGVASQAAGHARRRAGAMAGGGPPPPPPPRGGERPRARA